MKEEKEISYVTIDGENIITPENGVYKFVMPAHAVAVKAVTQDMRYAVNVEQIAGATIAVSSTLAKKGETIKVRVAITDSTKESPLVKAGDIDVSMALVENETKTFEGSFVEPGSDVSLLVTLSDAPAEYTILDKAGDGAVVVNAPKTAKAGDKVTFSMALDSGFEFAGEVKVTASDNEVEVMTNDDGTYSFVFLQGSTSSNLETEYLADSKDSTPTKYIARLKNDTKDIYVYAEKTGSKKATISEITSIQVANGLTSFTDEGAIFKATIKGEDKYFINRNGLLADYSTTKPLTLAGSLGTITTDGICNATVTKDGNTIDTTYSMDGESLTIIIDGKKHTLKVDTATNTYQELKFSAGLYIGGKVSSSHSYYKMQLTTDFKGKWESGSNSAITFNDDQTFTFSSYKVLLSDNKDLALVRDSSNTYLLSKDITTYSASSVGMEIVGLTNGTLKTGEKFVADIYDANTSSSSLVKKAVYFDGINYVFGSIKNNTIIDTKGTSFIFVTEDNHEISMKNNNGALEIAIDVSGTYTDTDTENNHGELILSNDGTGTLNNVAITYEVNSKDVITVKEGNTTYTISLANSTYTITNTEVLTLPAFVGQTFKGKIDYIDEYGEEYDSATYDAYIKFSSSEKTLSFSAGDGASASNVEGGEYLNNKNVEYTYDEASKEITVALNGRTVVFVYDSTKNTLTPKSQVDLDSFYFRPDSDYAFTKVA